MFTTDNINNIGGKSVQTKVLLNELKKLNLNVDLIQIPKRIDFVFILIPLFLLNKIHKGLGHIYALFARMIFLAIISLPYIFCKEEKLIVISQDAYGHQIFLKLKKFLKNKVKNIVIVHSLGTLTQEAVRDKRLLPKDWTTHLSLNMEIKGYLAADKIIVVSQAAKETLINELKKKGLKINQKVCVINNGIEITTNLGSVDQDDFKYDFCCIATLKPIKGHEVLLDAIKLLKKDYPNIRVAIVGGGKLYHYLINKARELNVLDNIDFLGNKNREEIFNILAKSKFFVLPSFQENFSISLLEAAFYGVPIVATNVGGNSEIIDHKVNGYLVPVNDFVALAEGMAWLMNCKNRKELGKSLKSKARRLWTSEQMAKNYYEIIKQL